MARREGKEEEQANFITVSIFRSYLQYWTSLKDRFHLPTKDSLCQLHLKQPYDQTGLSRRFGAFVAISHAKKHPAFMPYPVQMASTRENI